MTDHLSFLMITLRQKFGISLNVLQQSCHSQFYGCVLLFAFYLECLRSHLPSIFVVFMLLFLFRLLLLGIFVVTVSFGLVLNVCGRFFLFICLFVISVPSSFQSLFRIRCDYQVETLLFSCTHTWTSEWQMNGHKRKLLKFPGIRSDCQMSIRLIDIRFPVFRNMFRLK